MRLGFLISVRSLWLQYRYLSFAAVFVLAGCSSISTKSTGPNFFGSNAENRAVAYLQNAELHRQNREVELGYDLAAAALLSDSLTLQKGHSSTTSRDLYNRAVRHFTLSLTQNPNWAKDRVKRVIGPDQIYQVIIDEPHSSEAWKPTYFDDYRDAHLSRGRAWAADDRPGFGATLIGIRRVRDERKKTEPFASEKISAPVTAALIFGTKQGVTTVTIRFLNPIHCDHIELNRSLLPLAGHFSETYNVFKLPNELWNGLLGLFYADKLQTQGGLFLPEPYDPDRIPVVMVHGLLSTSYMWVPVVNQLNADPAIRDHYQFWYYYYPTGNPIAYSAEQFREKLHAMERCYPPGHGFVLIGHSMGGLLSRLQTIDPGRTIWDGVFHREAAKLYRRIPAEHIIKKSLIFSSDPNVRRVVFICVPHRGSPLATWSVALWASRLIRLPRQVVDTAMKVLATTVTFGQQRMLPTSIESLSPHSPLLLAIDGIPMHAPYHSIIGDRGRKDTPKSSDGVVRYESSHLRNAESELIVPSYHGGYGIPQSVAEMKRILHLHLVKTGISSQPLAQPVGESVVKETKH